MLFSAGLREYKMTINYISDKHYRADYGSAFAYGSSRIIAISALLEYLKSKKYHND